MTATQQKIVENQALVIRQKNEYSQAADRRECVFDKHKDGKRNTSCHRVSGSSLECTPMKGRLMDKNPKQLGVHFF